MAQRILVYWRDIPAQILVREGRKTARRELDHRFQAAIDRSAMRARLTGTDAYLEQWRRSVPVPCGDNLEAEADAEVARLDAYYDDERLAALVANYGQATS